MGRVDYCCSPELGITWVVGGSQVAVNGVNAWRTYLLVWRHTRCRSAGRKSPGRLRRADGHEVLYYKALSLYYNNIDAVLVGDPDVQDQRVVATAGLFHSSAEL